MIRWLFFLGCLSLMASACQSGPLHIKATYERLHGVAVDDQVLFEQNVAGRVTAVQYTEEGTYALTLEISRGFTNAVTQHAQFHIINDPHRKGRKAVDIRSTQPGGKVLADGSTVQGVSPSEALAERLQKDLATGFGFIQSQIERFSRDLQKIPDSDAYSELKQSLEALADDILRAEKEARDRFKKEWLPQIERQMEALREKLRQFGRENELKPLDEQVEKIRKI